MYKSPLHILSDLNADASEISDPGYLLRLRKKLLAEFNLSNSPTIDINGKQYSKDEVIKTIDVLLGNPQMPMHSFIFANKNLLDFLENDTSKVRPADLKGIVVPEEIRSMYNTVMLERIMLNMKKAFHARNFDGATELLTYCPEISEEEKAVLYEDINKNILNLQEHIQSVRANGCANIIKDLDYLKKNSLVVFLNKLPIDFIDTVNSLVGEIINTMVSYQKIKNHDRAYLYYVSNNLCKVKCDEELMKLIKANHRVFTQNYEGGGSSGSSSSGGGTGDVSAGRIIYIILIVVVFLIRLATCNRHSGSDYSNYDFSKYNNSFSNLAAERTEYEEFKSYRKHILKKKDSGNSALSMYDEAVDLYPSMSGNNPFKYVLTRATDYDYQDSSLLRVVINNKSGKDLIIVAFDDYNAKAYYFFKDTPDTLSFRENHKLCLYFGDSLVASKSSMNNSSISAYLKVMYEVYFKDVSDKEYDVLEKDYVIEFKNKAKPKKSKKKKKKTPLQVIKLDENFFKNNGFKNEKLELRENTGYSDMPTDAAVSEEVIVPAQ